MTGSPIVGLGYVGLNSPNFRTWAEIGPEGFAMESVQDDDANDVVFLRLDEHHHRIAMYDGERDELAYLGWEVRNDLSLDNMSKLVSNAGFAVNWASEAELAIRHVDKMFWFLDPSGHRFEIYSGAEIPRQPFHAPRHFGGFVTGDLGLGHVVLLVQDAQLEDQFLREVFGFRITDFVSGVRGSNVTFYRANSRHHSIAIGQSPTRRGIHHLMVELNELDDVGIAHGLAVAHDDLHLAMSLGRHANDRTLSFYVDTPTGLRFEYGWGGRHIDDENSSVVKRYAPAELWGHTLLISELPPTVGEITPASTGA